jgi:rhamnosyltransferase subunit B
MTQFLLTALGSYGDVHPMVGLGAALASRGHRVKIVTNPYFEEVVTGAGLELVPLGTRDDYLRISQHRDLWHHVRGPKLVLSYAGARMLRPLYDLLIADYKPGETVYCAHGMDLASRVAGEQLGAPVASVIFAPGLLWSIYDSPRLKGAFLGPRVPRWFKRFQFWVSDTLFVGRLLLPELNSLRRKLGMRPVSRIYSRWLFASDLVRAAATRLAAPHSRHWVSALGHCGVCPQFPLWENGD